MNVTSLQLRYFWEKGTGHVWQSDAHLCQVWSCSATFDSRRSMSQSLEIQIDRQFWECHRGFVVDSDGFWVWLCFWLKQRSCLTKLAQCPMWLTPVPASAIRAWSLGSKPESKITSRPWHGSGTCLTFWGRSRAGWKGRLADEVIPWSNPQALTLFPAWSPVDRIHKSPLSNHKIMLHKKSQAFSQNFESLFHPWSSLGYLWIMNWHHPLAWHSWLDAVVRLQRLLESRKALTCNQAVIAAIALLELLTCYQVKWLCPSNFVPRGRIACSCGISWTARLIQPRRFFGRVVLWCLLLIWIHLEGKCR